MKLTSINKIEFQQQGNCVDCSNLSISGEQLARLIDDSMSKALNQP